MIFLLEYVLAYVTVGILAGFRYCLVLMLNLPPIGAPCKWNMIKGKTEKIFKVLS